LEVGIKLKTAFATEKLGLRLTVAPVDVTASVTPLAGMPGVYSHNLAAKSFGFILQKSLELGEAPRVKPPFSLSSGCFHSFSDVGEVFHNDSSAGFNAVEDRGGDNVVAIPSEALFTPSEASKVPLGTLRTIGLQFPSEAKYSLNNFFHMPVAVKAVVRSNGRPGNPQVNADSLAIRDESNIRQVNHDVQVKLTPSIKQVSSSSKFTDSIAGILGHSNGDFHSALCGRQVYPAAIPIHLESVNVISRWAKPRLRTTGFSAMLQSGYRRFYSFGCFLASLDVQVRHKVGIGLFTVSISKAVKCIGIAILSFPAHLADAVKCSGKLSYCVRKSNGLFTSRKQFNTNHSVHADIIPYILRIMQILDRKEVCRNSSVA
jgi:hypothetical protein